jgi:hypothetical protein
LGKAFVLLTPAVKDYGQKHITIAYFGKHELPSLDKLRQVALDTLRLNAQHHLLLNGRMLTDEHTSTLTHRVSVHGKKLIIAHEAKSVLMYHFRIPKRARISSKTGANLMWLNSFEGIHCFLSRRHKGY